MRSTLPELHQVWSSPAKYVNNVIIILIIILVYYSCSQNATTELTAVTQDSTDTTECKASIYNETQHKV